MDSFRLRVEGMPDLERFRIGDRIQPIIGQIVATRKSMLVAFAQRALGPSIELSEARHQLLGDEEVPNPLLAYEEILSTFIEVNLSTVHRDFNLENILVDPETRDVKLIDFATVGLGHNLHDLLRLETEVWHLIVRGESWRRLASGDNDPLLSGTGLGSASVREQSWCRAASGTGETVRHAPGDSTRGSKMLFRPGGHG